MPVTVRQRNLQTRHIGRKLPGTKSSSNKKSGFWKSKIKSSEGEVLVTNAPTASAGLWFPSVRTALLCLLAARLTAAAFSHITDCDETYNYWEPLHYLIYGSGMQTWEYSPAYAIRSYASLWVWAAPAWLLTVLADVRPVFVFYALRCLLAALTALSETLFYKAVCQEFGVHVGRVWLALTLVSCGSFVSSAAMLPSSWCGALCTAALACWWLHRLPAAVGLVAAAALVGWPFAGLLGAPIAIDIVLRRQRVVDFIKWSACSVALLVPPLLAVDSWYYGRLVLAPWNIVAYNVFTERGPDLYGVEPWTFYILNGFLNFNITWVLALLCPLLLALCAMLIPHARPRAQFCKPYWLSLMPLYTWLAVFMLQPHKEERFLFPVYSAVCLFGALSVDCLQKLMFTAEAQFSRAWDACFGPPQPAPPSVKRSHYLAHTNFLMVLFLLVATLGGVSRILALYHNYHAPMRILSSLPLPAADGNDGELSVCFGKDWYRSPSSFHLPHERYRVRFIRSDFTGQMPAQYARDHNATRIPHPYFNDANAGDPRTYLAPAACHYLVDSDVVPPSPRQPHYASEPRWRAVATLPLLDAARSHRLLRAFYLPLLHPWYTTFGSIHLLRNEQLFADTRP